MILGLGNDLIDIRRIEKTLERFGDKFIQRIFTEVEQAKANRRKGAGLAYAATYAKRYAAKEAASKAPGDRFSSRGVLERPWCGQFTVRKANGSHDRGRS